jgi:hypothetical protein
MIVKLSVSSVSAIFQEVAGNLSCSTPAPWTYPLSTPMVDLQFKSTKVELREELIIKLWRFDI